MWAKASALTFKPVGGTKLPNPPKPLDQNLKAFGALYPVVYFDTVSKIAANLSGIDIKGVWLLGNEYSLLTWPLVFTIVFWNVKLTAWSSIVCI